MEVIGVGLIGCGSIGLHHLKKLLEIESARVVAACDINPQALETAGHEAGISRNSLYSGRQPQRNSFQTGPGEPGGAAPVSVGARSLRRRAA